MQSTCIGWWWALIVNDWWMTCVSESMDSRVESINSKVDSTYSKFDSMILPIKPYYIEQFK